MEQTALPLASRSQPPPPSTLAPPPLETAATGTRALQRFDLGRLRAADKPAEPAPVEAVPMPSSDGIPGTAPWPRFEMPAARGAIAKPRRVWPMPAPVSKTSPPFAIVRDAAWAFAAAVSLSVASSVVTALVYALAFP